MGRKNRKPAFDPLSPLDVGEYNNNKYYDFYMNYLVEMATSLFEWHNLPSTVNSWFIEMQLLKYGNVIYFNDDKLGHLVSNASMTGRLNLYNEPTGYRTVNVNYPPKSFSSFWGQPLTQDADKYCVLISNSYLKRPYILDLQRFAQDLAEISAIQAINLNAQKTPIVNIANRYNQLTAKALNEQLDKNPLNLIVTDGLDLDNLRTLDLGVSYLVDKLETQKHSKWNDAMTFLGINNNPSQAKKERLTSGEDGSNDSQVMLARYNRLGFRQLACKRINELFNTNISVTQRQIDVTPPDDISITNQNEGENNG